MGDLLRVFTVALAAVFILGCAGPEPSGPKKMMADLNQELTVCQKERSALAKETLAAQEQLAALKKEEQSGIKRLQNENLSLSLQVKELNEQMARNQKDAAIATLEKKVAAESKAPAPSTATAKARIKVLSGDGQVSSAKQLSAKVSSLGYKVDMVGKADRSTFRGTTVYYMESVKADALKIGKALNATARPLTWKSEFNIIVVSGKK